MRRKLRNKVYLDIPHIWCEIKSEGGVISSLMSYKTNSPVSLFKYSARQWLLHSQNFTNTKMHRISISWFINDFSCWVKLQVIMYKWQKCNSKCLLNTDDVMESILLNVLFHWNDFFRVFWILLYGSSHIFFSPLKLSVVFCWLKFYMPSSSICIILAISFF